jgi:hypothetical protein
MVRVCAGMLTVVPVGLTVTWTGIVTVWVVWADALPIKSRRARIRMRISLLGR